MQEVNTTCPGVTAMEFRGMIDSNEMLFTITMSLYYLIFSRYVNRNLLRFQVSLLANFVATGGIIALLGIIVARKAVPSDRFAH